MTVTFREPVVTPVTPSSLTLLSSGPDGRLDTADDMLFNGLVQWVAAENAIRLTLPEPLLGGRYRATLAAGLSDAAGNTRTKALGWEFGTGDPPQIVELFPPQNFVRVGGVLDKLEFTYDLPVPKILADAYVWKATRRAFPAEGSGSGAFGPAVEITPLLVTQSLDGRVFTLRTLANFPTGQYVVTGSGPNMRAMRWEFHFRDVPNEWVLHESGVGTWKHFPGPALDDSLIINAPGQLATIEAGNLQSLTARTDVRFGGAFGVVMKVAEPVQIFSGLELFGTRFKAGETHVRGLLAFRSASDFNVIDIGPHTLNAYGGGYMRSGGIRFSDPAGALVNHPGSTLVLSNGTSVVNSGINWADAGRIVNLGTLRSAPTGVSQPVIRLEDVRVRNDGLIEVASGGLTLSSLENEGVIDIAADARLVLLEQVQGGFSARITGTGSVEFGQYDTSSRRIVGLADAEWKGEVDPGVTFTLVAGTVTLWKPLVRPAGAVELRNGSLLKLLGPADIGTVTLTDGNLAFNSDSRIGDIDFGSTAELRSETLVRITGNARIGLRLETAGQGLVEFAGVTVVSNRTQTANAQIGHASIRNTGTWRQSGGGSSGTGLLVRKEDGGPGRGAFENLGLFEQTTDRVLNVTVPFRNLGRAVFSRGPVVFDGRVANERFGAYLHGPAAELVLNNTDFQHDQAGSIEFSGGLVRGTGTIRAVDGTTRPKVTNRAVLRPGNPVGALTIRATGGFEQTSTGELAVTLASADHSRLTLTGTSAALAGTLRVELAEGFSPNIGQTFNVMTFTSRTGEFGNVVLPGIGPDKKLEAVYSATAVTVRVVAAR